MGSDVVSWSCALLIASTLRQFIVTMFIEHCMHMKKIVYMKPCLRWFIHEVFTIVILLVLQKKMSQGIIILLIENLFYCKRDFLLSGIIFSKIIGKKQSSEASIVNLQRNELHVFRKQCLYTGRWRRTISSGLLLGDDSLKWEAPFWSYQDIGRSN